MMAARVAGVPSPQRFIVAARSSSLMEEPAFFIASRSEASVCGLGGFVTRVSRDCERFLQRWPFSRGGSF